MEHRYFGNEEFAQNFGKTLRAAGDYYEQLQQQGSVDRTPAFFTFSFISDTQQKLQQFSTYLKKHYNYNLRTPQPLGDKWLLSGVALSFSLTFNNVVYWVVDMYCRGYQYDALLHEYSAPINNNPEDALQPQASMYDYYIEQAAKAHEHGHTGMAIIHLSTAIEAAPHIAETWYRRAMMKEQLHTPKAARKDYDKAIELSPGFLAAIINRAANKDDCGEYRAAIEDYDMALNIDAANAAAYFNRGNSKHHLGDLKGAYADWRKAHDLGSAHAQEKIDAYC